MRPILALPLLLAAPALADSHAETLDCSGPAQRFTLDRTAETCAVDGTEQRLVEAGPPFVCHVSNPQLRILTVEQDLSYAWEDTDDDRVIRGTCRPR